MNYERIEQLSSAKNTMRMDQLSGSYPILRLSALAILNHALARTPGAQLQIIKAILVGKKESNYARIRANAK